MTAKWIINVPDDIAANVEKIISERLVGVSLDQFIVSLCERAVKENARKGVYSGFLKPHLPVILAALNDGKKAPEIERMIGERDSAATINRIKKIYKIGHPLESKTDRIKRISERNETIFLQCEKLMMTVKEISELHDISTAQIKYIVTMMWRAKFRMDEDEVERDTREFVLRPRQCPLKIYEGHLEPYLPEILQMLDDGKNPSTILEKIYLPGKPSINYATIKQIRFDYFNCVEKVGSRND